VVYRSASVLWNGILFMMDTETLRPAINTR